ncbi:SGNH/GDSL hydrolase family protein [Asticcacaulis sp. AC402]|uniref:SGNH/GDSL hydrolase family protein n=1 Tax=Asticcacaulis sp. AC402 TaxID=1282361 RepID=UPI0003C3F466|nr:SGNH/GDSL hydrolase family protein [Asticcacaulis sp. AC402]ESQ73475.1 hypothetical protein ABAC402_19050 [Asticcacaulis sp. AC402]
MTQAQPGRLKAIVVGGSNSVYYPGYVFETIKQCKERGLDLTVIDDLAVGATTSLAGLYNLVRSQQVANADVLIIEYALNDSSAYEHERKLLHHWSRVYEAMLRLARRRNPRLHVISVIIEPRRTPPQRRLNYLQGAIHKLSDWYDTEVVDTARPVLAAMPSRDDMYLDPVHYGPGGIGMTGVLLADSLCRLAANPRAEAALPEPVDIHNFEHAHALATELFPGTEPTVFQNSRFRSEAVTLTDSDLTFQIRNGRLLALMYVCEANTRPLYIKSGGRHFHYNIMKPGVAEGQFRFLVSMAGTEFLYPDDIDQPAPASRDYHISQTPWPDTATVVTPANGVPSPVDGQSIFSLMGILYSGDLIDFTVRPPHAQET